MYCIILMRCRAVRHRAHDWYYYSRQRYRFVEDFLFGDPVFVAFARGRLAQRLAHRNPEPFYALTYPLTLWVGTTRPPGAFLAISLQVYRYFCLWLLSQFGLHTNPYNSRSVVFV